jgi:hypothetical protein
MWFNLREKEVVRDKEKKQFEPIAARTSFRNATQFHTTHTNRDDYQKLQS